ncbi:hypothetical protein BH10PAT3_BH10PAT3_6310 [soil metagenome]
MSDSGKHTIYVDIDDEITSIINKVKAAPDKIVALVLPKRATVLQSIINMKLLKKSAAASKKSIVLITSEAGLLPLAGAVGMHVAKTLQSKPVIPLAPDRGEIDEPEISEAVNEPALDTAESVGALAANAAVAEDEDETIELQDVDVDDALEEGGKKPKKAGKRFKVPNFDRFRLSFFLGILAILLLITGWIFAAIILPRATVLILTDSTTTLSKVSFTANTALKDLDVTQGLVPAVLKEVKKTDTEKTTATGKKDNGTKADGIITVRNCDYPSGFTVPAGSVFTAAGKSFINGDSAQVPSFTGLPSTCSLSGPTSGKVNIPVTAQSGGEAYNIAANQYNVPGAASGAKVDAIGSEMTGGTTKVVTVVSQEDVDSTVAKMKGRLDGAAKKELATQLNGESLKSLEDTLVISPPVITATPAVGTEAAGEVTVSQQTTYNILGVKSSYLSQLVKKDAGSKIDTAKQSILDDGLGAAVIRLENRKSPTEAQMSLQALVVAGPQLNAGSIKEEIKGKKRGDAEKIITAKKGVKDVTITYKPFWVLSTPKSIKKITITIEKPAVTQTTKATGANP